MASAVTITAYPNNEIRVRLSPLPRAREIKEEDARALFREENEDSDEGPNLDISSELKTHTHSDLAAIAPPSVRKPTKFGINAKRIIQRVGGVIDRITSCPQESLFLTGTLPGSTHEAYQAIADYAPYIINCLKAWIAKRIPDKKDFYVWELQERGALHLHYCLVVPESSVRSYIKDNFKSEWNRILDRVGRAAGVDMFRRSDGTTWALNTEVTQAYAVEVEKSVAAYLSKYTSKYSTKYTSSNSENGLPKYYPKRWWGCSRPLLKLLCGMTTRVVRVGYGVNQLRSIYESLTAELESFSIKGFRYGDKVGTGLNHVYYFLTQEFDNVSEYIMAKYDAIRTFEKRTEINAPKLMAQALTLLDTQGRMGVYIRSNLSATANKASQLSLCGIAPSFYETYALATEMESLLMQYCLYNPYQSTTVNRLCALCHQVENYAKNKIEIDESQVIG